MPHGTGINHLDELSLLAGKPKDKALELLASLPGIERVSIQSSGFGDDTRIPKEGAHIHLLIFSAAVVS
jgi:hypothetical protein